MKPDARTVINFVGFQVAWFACVYGGARDLALAGTLVALAAVVLHLAMAPRRGPELMLVLIVTAIGTFWDSLLVSLGLMRYPAGNFAPGVAPYWILAMWALFATTLNLSMAWLKRRTWLAVLMGAAGGPLAYFAGHRLGGVELPDPALALLAQALGWAVLMPLLTRIAEYLNGFAPPPVARTWSAEL